MDSFFFFWSTYTFVHKLTSLLISLCHRSLWSWWQGWLVSLPQEQKQIQCLCKRYNTDIVNPLSPPLLAGTHQQLRNVTKLVKPLVGKQRRWLMDPSLQFHAQNIVSLKSKHIPVKSTWLKIWFLLRSAWPCDYPTHIRKQSQSTAASFWCPVQSNKWLIHLTLNLWLQSAGRTGSTEMTPAGPETGRHSQIFGRNTLERSAPNRWTSRPKPCPGSAWPQRETWFTSQSEKFFKRHLFSLEQCMFHVVIFGGNWACSADADGVMFVWTTFCSNFIHATDYELFFFFFFF